MSRNKVAAISAANSASPRTSKSSYDIEVSSVKTEMLPSWLFRLIFVIVWIIHLTSCLFLFLNGGLHFTMKPAAITSLGLWNAKISAIVFFIFSLLHLRALLSMSCCKHTSKPPEDKEKEMTNSKSLFAVIKKPYDTYLGPSGIFGRHGSLYEARMALREIIEIPSQTLQVYFMSTAVTSSCSNQANSNLMILYILLLAFNSFTSPLMLQSRRFTVRRRLTILTDAIFDYCFSVIFPLVLQKPVLMYLVNPKLINDKFFMNEMRAVLKHIMITSFLDLITKLLPFMFNYFMLRGLIRSMNEVGCKSKCVDNVKPRKESRIISVNYLTMQILHLSTNILVQRFFQFSSVMWSLGLIGVGYLSLNREPCPPFCAQQLHPWFTKSCKCAAYELNCKKLNIGTMHSVENHISGLSSSIRMLDISQCPITKTPSSILFQHFQDLTFLGFYNTPLKTWAIESKHLATSLNAIQVDGNNFTDVPDEWRNLPPAVVILRLSNNNLKRLPSWIANSWRKVTMLDISGNEFEQFPIEILQLPDIQRLIISRNNIRSLPKGLSSLTFMEELAISYNNLDELPSDIGDAPRLSRFLCDGNNISSIPTSMLKNLNKFKILHLSSTRICSKILQGEETKERKALRHRLAAVCEIPCSFGCEWYNFQNKNCDIMCNNKACEFDGGDCRNLV